MGLLRDSRIVPILSIVLLALVAHGVSLGGGLYFDDIHSVRDNPGLRDPANFFAAFYDGSLFSALPGRMYRPSVISTLVFDHWIGNGEAWMFKFTNLTLHVIVALFVRAVAIRLRLGATRSLLAGLAFAAHPLASEAVHGISSRSDQMLALGTLWAVWAATGPGSTKIWRRVQVLFATALACGAKETGVLIPLLLACFAISEQVRAGRFDRGVWITRARRLLPVAVVVLAYLGIRAAVLSSVDPLETHLKANGHPMIGGGRDSVTQFAVMGQVLPRFLAQAFVPLHLSLDPPIHYGASPTSTMVLAGWGAVLAATAFGLSAWRRRPVVALAVCGVWALSAPWVLVSLNSPAMEHRAYGPLAFGAIGLAAFLPRRLAFGVPGAARSLRRQVVLPAIAGLLLVSTALSFDRGYDYLDERRLWESVLTIHPSSYHAHCGLAEIEQAEGLLASSLGDNEKADHHLRLAEAHARGAAVRIPVYLNPWRLLTDYQLVFAKPLLAKHYARNALDSAPLLAMARVNYANALVQSAKEIDRPEWFREAEAMAVECLGTDMAEMPIYCVLADAAEQLGDPARAESYYEAAYRKGLRFPQLLQAYLEFSVRQGRTRQARLLAQHLVVADPANEAALSVLNPASPR